MGLDSDSLRRKLGLVCLGVAAGMLLLGQTDLKASLEGQAFLLYWLICFLFTFAAILIALMDIRSVRRQTRNEARELLQKTLGKVDLPQGEKPRCPDDPFP